MSQDADRPLAYVIACIAVAALTALLMLPVGLLLPWRQAVAVGGVLFIAVAAVWALVEVVRRRRVPAVSCPGWPLDPLAAA